MYVPHVVYDLPALLFSLVLAIATPSMVRGEGRNRTSSSKSDITRIPQRRNNVKPTSVLNEIPIVIQQTVCILYNVFLCVMAVIYSLCQETLTLMTLMVSVIQIV